jgi:hypothetical protein
MANTIKPISISHIACLKPLSTPKAQTS